MKKRALVTGGNSGIGLAIAGLLVEKGYAVHISGRNTEKIRQAAEKIGVTAHVADMANPEAIKSLASNFLDDGLDVLVNNAGVSHPKPISAVTEQDFSDTFDVNIRGPLLLIKELLSALEKREGCVTSVSSVIVKKGTVAASLYAASKGAVDAFTKSLAIELAPMNIRINAVAPGLVETPIYDKMGLPPDDLAAGKEMLKSGIPMKRFGTPEEVAQVILAQIESSYVTGSVWDIDGGFTA